METDPANRDIDSVLEVAKRSETQKDEQVIWSSKPDVSILPFQLIRIPLVWLAGLFLYSVGVMSKSGAYDGDSYFKIVIIVFVLIALMGIAEVIAIPIQAKKTIYVVTNLRTFIIKLRGKFGYSGMTDYSLVSKKLIRPEKSTLYFYYAYTVPFQIIFIVLLFDVISKILADYNIYCLSGFLLLIVGWLYQWYQDFRIPLPAFREVPKAFYLFNEWISSVETVDHSTVSKVYTNIRDEGSGSIFIISKNRGCMRLKAVPEAKQVKDKIEKIVIDSISSKNKEAKQVQEKSEDLDE